MFPVVLAVAYYFLQLLLRTFLTILQQPRVHCHIPCHFSGFQILINEATPFKEELPSLE